MLGDERTGCGHICTYDHETGSLDLHSCGLASRHEYSYEIRPWAQAKSFWRSRWLSAMADVGLFDVFEEI